MPNTRPGVTDPVAQEHPVHTAAVHAARRPAAFRRQRLERILTEDHRTVSLGMSVTTLDEERIVVEQRVGPDDVNGLGICHGGVTFTLADSATGIGANTLDEESAWVTVTSEIHFRGPAHIDDVLEASCTLVEAPSARRRVFETVVRARGAADEVREDAGTGDDAPAGRVVATVDSVMVRLRERPGSMGGTSA
ncbi:PaaI family thioesterase [Pseudoclavibacter chungangensis]|uniref:PaaI family thioesterase n=1 Tax=Pseudoclavibacter chungangensis TaxID=587635 RepID=A0A7J5BQY9_9MICO|nr:PaaI family thioesterase [Pseudoclavibacter chungangensis]KAB1654287.1 PaaI family thioesterase [Pseudoclavibacter chungangensis]NYJ65307.1 uncharacterized protein (TIGR00369 family) [Pseudoclavibacter chungangensis]